MATSDARQALAADETPSRRTVQVRTPAPELTEHQQSFLDDPLFLPQRPDTRTVTTRSLRPAPDPMRGRGRYRSEDTIKRQAQEAAAEQAAAEQAARDARRRSEREISSRIAWTEQIWETAVVSAGKRRNAHLAARWLYTWMLVNADHETMAMPAGLCTPDQLATEIGMGKRTIEQELAVLHDAGLLSIDGLRDVAGQHSYGGEISFPATSAELPNAGTVAHLLTRAWQVMYRVHTHAEKVVYLYVCAHPAVAWSGSDGPVFAPLVEPAALAPKQVIAATGLHRNAVRPAMEALMARGVLEQDGDRLVITDPRDVHDIRPIGA